MPRLLSLNVGLPKDVAWQGKTVHTAVWKAPVAGRRLVRRLNIDGDGQGDLAGHGGEHRAVLVYQRDSYDFWQAKLERSAFAFGQFGENFTVDGLADAEVCIGDRYRIGEALFEVTQPRVTCYRLGIRMDEPEMASLLVRHGRPGFYLRVLEEGQVGSGDEITRVKRGREGVTVAEVNALLYLPPHPPEGLERAIREPTLSEGWRASLQALLAQARAGDAGGNAGLTGAAEPPPAWRGFRELRVAEKIRESAAVTSLLLEATDGQPLAQALPGQFIVLRMGSGTALVRSYSLSGARSSTRYRVSIKREPEGRASRYADDQLQPGNLVGASAPRGSFTLSAASGPVVLMSAGIGVTPVLAMLHALAAEASPRQVWWFYGTRNGREHPFAAEVGNLLRQLPNAVRHIVYSAPDRADRPQIDYDARGHLDVELIRTLGVPLTGDFYVCGPAGFMEDMTRGLSQRGVADAHIHTEAFGPGRSVTPGIGASPAKRPHPPVSESSCGPSVTFAKSGLAVHWQPDSGSLLELAEACDVPVRWSCRTGVCHMCETSLVAGQVNYAPEPLDPPADGNLLICCSRPNGDVVLDL